MKKKILSLVLSTAMVLSLCACGTSNKDVENEDSSAISGSDSQESALNESVDSAYWFSTVSGFGPANWNVDESPATEYIKENFGIEFNLEQPPTDADTKLGLMLATQDLPDLISAGKQETVSQLIQSGQVWAMQEFLEKYDPDSWMLKEFPADVKKSLEDVYGGWYAYSSHMESVNNRDLYPANDQVWKDIVEKGNNSCIMFNKDIMEELNISEDMVKTEEGFYQACEIVKNSGYQVDGQSVVPIMLHANGWIDSSLDAVLSWNFGALQIDADGNYIHRELSPGYKNALKFVNTCIQKGYVDINSLTIDETALKSYLDAKRVFCWIGNQAQQSKDNMPWVSYGPIVADNSAQPCLPVNKSAGIGWIQTMVSKKAKNPEKLAKMLSWITSREGLLMDYYGIEGDDYNIDDAGFVTRTEEGAKKYADNYKSNVFFWSFANTSFERNTEPVPDPTTNRGVEVSLMPALGKYEKTYIYDASLIDFSDSVIEPSSDLGISLSQVKSYLESQKAKIVTATTDADFEKEYNSMISTLEQYNIKGIDQAYDVVYKENCKNIGDKIEDVNASLYK